MSDFNLQFQLDVKDGIPRMPPNERQLMLQYVKTLKDGRYLLRIKKDRESQHKFASERRYIFGTVYTYIQEETGQDIETIHNELKLMFLYYDEEIVDKNGVTVVVPCVYSLSDDGGLNVQDLKTYARKCRMWAKDVLNVDIPEKCRVVNRT